MAIIEKATIKTEAMFSDDKKHRLYLRKEWDKSKKSALVLMLSAGECNGLTMDFSTLFCTNNLVKLDMGSIEVMNLFSEIHGPIKAASLKDKKMIDENNKMLLKKAESTDIIIFAWGRAGNTNKVVQERIDQVTKLLSKHAQKTCILGDSSGRKGFHPLAPQVRQLWNLHPIT